jgi:pimeloyl-ACP methyl ester carboxylesterase
VPTDHTQPEGVEHRQVHVGGLALHVAIAGEGPPLLLQHGWPQYWWCWREVIGPLATHHRVICPDLRGFGGSQAPASMGRLGAAFEKERLADDLLGLLDALELERVGLVGHDWGGLAGFLACLRAPHRFTAFLALAINHPWPQARRIPDPRAVARLWYQAVIATPLVGGALLRSRGAVKRMLETAGRGVFDEHAVARYADALSSAQGARSSVALYRSFLARELGPLIRGRYAGERLRVPTRLLVGERDPVLTADSLAGFEAHADDMTLEWVPDAGHFLPEERPGLVVQRARELFD